MKKGFALIIAVIFVVLIATLGALSLSLSSSSVKQTSSVFLKEQAELLALSATQHAVLALQAHDFNASNPNATCLESIDSIFPEEKQPIFNINVSIRYIGNNLPKKCNKNVILHNGEQEFNNKFEDKIYINDNSASNRKDTQDNYIIAIIDAVVTSEKSVSPEPVRFHKRTVQSLNFLTTNQREEKVNKNTAIIGNQP